MTRPLLSRRQLSLLILFLPGLILLLTLLGPVQDTTAADWQADADRRVYQRPIPQQTDYRLHLLLPTPLADSNATELEQRLLLAALQQRLSSAEIRHDWQQRMGALPKLHLRPGYLLLELNLEQAPNPDELALLLQQLQQPAQLEWAQQLQRVQAQHYLLRQEAEIWLKSQFPGAAQALTQTDPVRAYHQWLQPHRWRLTLTGPEPIALTLPSIDPDAGPIPTAPPLALNVLPLTPPTPPAPLQLHRWPLPAISSADHFALSLLARESLRLQLSAWLAQQPPNVQAGFSLNWTPAPPQGRATLIVQGKHWPPVRTWLAAALTHADLAAARAAVQQQLTQPNQQQAWADLLALHQLPADTLAQLPDRLAAISHADLQHWLQPLLESDYYHTLSLPALP
jgi:hypothetical protein